MSNSGVPVVSQAAGAYSYVKNSVDDLLSSASQKPLAPTAPQVTATPDNPETAAAMQGAADTAQRRSRGAAATLFAGAGGNQNQPTTSRAVLLGA